MSEGIKDIDKKIANKIIYNFSIIMYIHYRHAVRLVLCFLLLATPTLLLADDYETIMQRIRNDYKQENPDITSILKVYNDTKGTFTDIDYSRTDKTNWPPYTHISRIKQMAFAYTNSSNKQYGSDALYNKIVKALRYWPTQKAKSENWWYNELAVPRDLAFTLVQMRTGKKRVPAKLESSLLQYIKKNSRKLESFDPAAGVGASMAYIYRSCLEKNKTDLAYAISKYAESLKYTTDNGCQYDGSYLQHGKQLYIGGYGSDYFSYTTQIAGYVRGTQFAFSKEQIAFLSTTLRNIFYAPVRGRYISNTVSGRSISRPNSLSMKEEKVYAERMIDIDPAHADEYRTIINRIEEKVDPSEGISPSHTHCFLADYSLHRRPSYLFDVRLSSTRACRVEYGNNENLKGYFLADGCTNLLKRGNEYYNIFPTWNWARVPGTTAPQMKDIPLGKNEWALYGTSTFAGGVSDSLYGATAYAYDDQYADINTKAHKAWFFFDDEIVCLGAGITSTSGYEVMTTANQCLASGTGAVTYKVRGKKQYQMQKGGKGLHGQTGVQWTMYDGVGYVFPQGGKIEMTCQQAKGSWYDINNVYSKDIKSNDVFTLAVTHGRNPSNATYAYYIVPVAKSGTQLDQYMSGQHVTILRNTEDLQAVYQQDLGIWQAVFYKKGTYTDNNVTISVDKPCVVMLRKKADGHVTFHIADPSQSQQPINATVKVNGVTKGAKNLRCDFTGKGIYAGKSLAYTIK